MDPVDLKLKEGAMPICLIPHPVPKVHKEMFKMEVEHSVLLGVPEIANDSEWGALFFVKHKYKSNRVSFLSEFRNLNKKLNRKIYSMPNINEM